MNSVHLSEEELVPRIENDENLSLIVKKTSVRRIGVGTWIWIQSPRRTDELSRVVVADPLYPLGPYDSVDVQFEYGFVSKGAYASLVPSDEEIM